jgi:hypothetical protein
VPIIVAIVTKLSSVVTVTIVASFTIATSVSSVAPWLVTIQPSTIVECLHLN